MAADIPTTDTGRTGRSDPTDQKIAQDYPELADWLATDLLARHGRAIAVLVAAYATAHGQGPAWLDVAIQQRPALAGYPHWARRWYAEHLIRGLGRRRRLTYGTDRGSLRPGPTTLPLLRRAADRARLWPCGSSDIPSKSSTAASATPPPRRPSSTLLADEVADNEIRAARRRRDRAHRSAISGVTRQ